jgi:hypothetical protein
MSGPAQAARAAREELLYLTGPGYAEAAAARPRLATLALEARNAAAAAAGLPPLGSVEAYAAELARRTVCLTLLAGSGSRWVRSLAAARERGEARAAAFDPEKPRGLFPVPDLLGLGRGPGGLAVAAYALVATRGLGRHLLVVRGWEAEIEAGVLEPLGIGPGERDFFTQAAPFGKPLGHGDAAWQCRALWRGADYVVTNFGGDANSRRTILSSLLVLDALNLCSGSRGSASPEAGSRAPRGAVDLLVPAAPVERPAYPIELDSGGLPRSFGQAKLQGRALTVERGYTNVGLRAYRAAALLEKVESARSRHWIEGEGYAIPGNDPAGHEFALDNVDAELAAEGRARILAAARPEELTPAKSYDDLPAFERAIARVVEEDRE